MDDVQVASRRSAFKRVGCGAAVVAVVVLAGVSLVGCCSTARRSAARWASCNCHLKQIGLAIANYES